MQDYVKRYTDKIEHFLKSKEEKAELLIIGGLAMSYYGIPRHTVDIDAEINCNKKTYFDLVEYLKQEKISFNIGENISGWGIIPLPSGYRDRAREVYRSDSLVISLLDPADFVFSKLMRGTEEDFNDAIDVIKKFDINKELIDERKNLIDFPKDPETLLFRKKYEHLMELIRQ